MTIQVGAITLKAYRCPICGMKASSRWLVQLCEVRHFMAREEMAGRLKRVMNPRGGYRKELWPRGMLCVDCGERPATVRERCQRCYQRRKTPPKNGRHSRTIRF